MTSGKKGVYRDFVAGKRLVHHVYVWEEEWAVVSRDDVDGESHGHELPSAESSDNAKTHELRDDYIITE